MSWFLYTAFAALFFYLVRRMKFFRLPGLPAWAPHAFFLARIIAGFALWAIYTFYYTDRQNSDIWKYFDDSKTISEAAFSHPGDFFRMMSGIGDDDPRIVSEYYRKMNHWDQAFDNNLVNDAHIVIRFNAGMRLISMGNYHTHALFMSFLAFIGLCAVYRSFHSLLRGNSYALAAILFLFPSLLFWGSGVMKEGLMLFALGIIVHQAFAFFSDQKWKRLLFICLAAWLLFITKFYVLAALVPSLVAAGFALRKPGMALIKFAVIIVLFLAAGLGMKLISTDYDPLRILAWKQNDFVRLAGGGTYLVNDSIVAYVSAENPQDLIAEGDSNYRIREGADYMYWYYDPDFSDTLFAKNSRDLSHYRLLTSTPRAGSITETELLQPNLASFAKASPRALVKSLLRPFPWEAGSLIMLLPALENLLLPLLILILLFARRKSVSPALTGFCLGYAILLLLVMGLTTPVLGALVRYRIAALPFLLIGLLTMIDSEKLANKFRKKTNYSNN